MTPSPQTQAYLDPRIQSPSGVNVSEFYEWYKRRKAKRLHRKDIALMIEDFVANDKTITEIAKKYSIPYQKAAAAIRKYYKKEQYPLTILSKV